MAKIVLVLIVQFPGFHMPVISKGDVRSIERLFTPIAFRILVEEMILWA